MYRPPFVSLGKYKRWSISLNPAWKDRPYDTVSVGVGGSGIEVPVGDLVELADFLKTLPAQIELLQNTKGI